MLNAKRGFAMMVAAMLLLSAVSCGAGEKKEDTSPESGSGTAFLYSFTDSGGTSVTLSEKPKKVAVLFSSLADIWVTAGGTVDITVGESVERGFADAAAVLVDPGSGHNAIDLETLVDAEPDLVIGTADYKGQTQAVETCRQAGIPAALFRVESVEDYITVLKIFCGITENEGHYNQYGTAVATQIDTILDRVKQANADTRNILFIRAGSSAKSTKAKTAEDHFACLMLDQLGTVNIADTEHTLAGTLSLETIIDQAPDYLFITTMGDETAAKGYMNSLLQEEGWRELDCVKEGNYCYLPKDLFHYKPNARWAEAYEFLAAILYPENVSNHG